MTQLNVSPDAATGKTALIDYLMDIDSRPSWVTKDVFDFNDQWDCLDIVMFGSYHIKLQYDPSCSSGDTASSDDGCAYGKYDLMYAYDIMDNRDEIIVLAKEAGLNSKCICDSVVAKIREYVKNYDGIMVDYNGSSACIHMGWDNFTDDEKDYAMENEHAVMCNTKYYLSKDNITVKEVFVDERCITVYVECK